MLGLLAVLALSGCAARPTGAIFADRGAAPAPAAVAGLRSHDIFVMTTRAPSDDPALMYAGARAGALGYARVTITIPPNHQVGAVERPQRPPANPETEFAAVDPTVFADDAAFLADLDRALDRRPIRERRILVFVHGFNTTYADAVLRLAQFVEDSGFDGVPVLFSWASAGKVIDYVYDLNSALAARTALIEASDVLVRSRAAEVNLLAHSMGNFLTVEAMRQAQIEGRFDSSGKLNAIILASADIDVDVFAEQMAAFDPKDRTFYVLISEDDKALATSRFLARGVNRVGDGDAEHLAALGVTVIDMTNVDDPNNLNHSKFSDSSEVVQLIGGVLRRGDTLDASSSQDDILSGALRGLADTASSLAEGGRVIVLPGE